MTIQELMRDAGCEKWPERWDGLFDGVLADFEKNGCKYLTPAYYDEIAEQYGIFTENLALYKQAAGEVAKAARCPSSLPSMPVHLQTENTSTRKRLPASCPKVLRGRTTLRLICSKD